MNLRITLVAVFVGLISFSNAQDSHVKEYASFLVDIEKSIDSKAMLKAWKKRKSDWEEETGVVSTSDELNVLSEEFIANLSPKVVPAGSMPKLRLSADYENYGKDLSRFVLALPQDVSTLNATDFRTNVLAVGQQFKQEEMAANARKIKAEIKPDFTSVFKLVFEDAKKGSFAQIADSKIDESTYSVRNKMKLSDKSSVTIDEEKIYTYSTDVPLTDDLETAKSVMKDLIAIIKSNTPKEYIEGEWLDETYVDRTIYQYEFEAENFSVTAKKPTVAIGLVKKGMLYYVVWSVTEPVFKDWKATNRDWNARDGK